MGDPVPKGGGVFKLGDPYLAGGKWYVPVNDRAYDRIGLASWYGDFFHGRRTANGEIYDMNALTGAHPTLPLPTYAAVTNLANNRTSWSGSTTAALITRAASSIYRTRLPSCLAFTATAQPPCASAISPPRP